MLKINKNANNTLIVTLNEKKTLTSPYYLFRFTNDITQTSVRFLSADLSLFKDRYNKFLITETSGTNDYSSGVITLSPTGFWSYTIYDQASSSNLDENLSTGIVEIGRVQVVGTETAFDKHTPNNTFISYGTGSGI